MTLDQIIAIASKAYEDDVAAGTRYQQRRLALRDGLARFIANELAKTYDPAASTADQLQEASRVIKVAHDELFRVWNAFVAERCREAEGE